ncbi:hypothetical protein Hanom_Chr01g00043161 [Helianthus anomalus]
MCHTSLCMLHIVPSSHQDYRASRICNTFKRENHETIIGSFKSKSDLTNQQRWIV